MVVVRWFCSSGCVEWWLCGDGSVMVVVWWWWSGGSLVVVEWW